MRLTCRQRAAPVPLLATTTLRLKAEQLEDLLDWDFRAQAVEVDAGHAWFLRPMGDEQFSVEKEEGPFRSHYL